MTLRPADRLLGHLHLAREAPTLDFLHRLVREHQRRVPFETLTKLIDYEPGLRRGDFLPPIEEYVDRIVRRGAGGLCWTLARGFHHLLRLFEVAGASLVVCGHTHMAFDRMVGSTRVVNAGSVGAPFGEPGACWVLLGPGVEQRRTTYDLDRAAALFRGTSYPQAEEEAQSLLQPPTEDEMLAVYSKAEVR